MTNVNPSDRKLGMHRDITRRDFIHDLGLASLALSIPGAAWASVAGAEPGAVYYPPTRTGLRGSHPGSFEVAHALAREHKVFEQPRRLDESYDLVVVGGGLSGLAAAHFYRKLHGHDASILILDNHDDFGGHAKRNEFHQGGSMRLAWGGTVNMEYTKYSAIAKGLLDELGIDIPRLLEGSDFGYMNSAAAGLKPGTWFDADTYGRDVLVPGMVLRDGATAQLAAAVGAMPIPEAARAALRRFLEFRGDVLSGMSQEEKRAYLKTTSYSAFLREHFALPDEALQCFSAAPMSFWGVRAENLSAMECLETGLPGAHALGDFREPSDTPTSGPSPDAMFPDGNASIARLLVRSLIPGSFPAMPAGSDPFGIVTAMLDYGQLDQAASPVRLRLGATAVHAENSANETGVEISYVKDGAVLPVRGKHGVLACYNNIIPSLCPQLPETQKAALRQCVKRPLLVVNVVLRNGLALQKSGVSAVYLPGRLCQGVSLLTGVNVADYRPQWRAQDPSVVQFYGAIGAPQPDGLSIAEQNRAGRALLLGMSFEDHEREVRTVLKGIWGPSGLDPAEDILAITVNRWPHGYARDHLHLEDPAWNADPPPNVVGRQTFGHMAIANSDAGADAYTQTAIDQAWRAVNELPALSA
jgi:spermidine dehydrogenase